MAGATDDVVEWRQQSIEEQPVSEEDYSMAEETSDIAFERDNVSVAMDDASSEIDHDITSEGETTVAGASAASKNDKRLGQSQNTIPEGPSTATIDEASSGRPIVNSYRRDSTATDDSRSEYQETEELQIESSMAGSSPSGEQELAANDDVFESEKISFPTSKDSRLIFLDTYKTRCDENGIRHPRKKFEFDGLFKAELCRYMVESDYFHNLGVGLCSSTLDDFFKAYKLFDGRKDQIARAFFINEIMTCAAGFTSQVKNDGGFTIETEEISGLQRQVPRYKRGYEYIGDLGDWDGTMRRQFLELPAMELAAHLYTEDENRTIQRCLAAVLDVKLSAISGGALPPTLPSVRTPTSRLQYGVFRKGAEARTLPTPSPTPIKKRRGSANDPGEEGGGKRTKLGSEKGAC